MASSNLTGFCYMLGNRLLLLLRFFFLVIIFMYDDPQPFAPRRHGRSLELR
jgi:hypothetical protein